MISLQLPLRDIAVNQPFGVNYLDFYIKMGLKGHNGVDFRTRDGCPCYSSHQGVVVWAGVDGDGGISVEIWDQNNGFKTLYYHLKDVAVKLDDKIMPGQLIGRCDNTGKYTTGDHLHFGLKRVALLGDTLDKDNGYAGSIDPSFYFFKSYIGTEISPKDYDKSRCYHRYYRSRTWNSYLGEKKMLATLLSKGVWASTEKINALVYGGWDLPSVINPAMYEVWSQLKKDEFIDKHLIPFQ